jgi:hypothetical protein
MKIINLAMALAATMSAPMAYSWTSQYKAHNRICVHSTEAEAAVFGSSFKDENYEHMKSLGFSDDDVATLQSECKAYFLEYYGIDVSVPDSSVVMFGERVPEHRDSRVLLDTANLDRNNDPDRSYVIEDTGCVLQILSAGDGIYGGKNAGMPRAAGDLMVYGYANIFDPQKPILKENLVERIKFKPAWPIKVVPVPNKEGLKLLEGVFKVEAEYRDAKGSTHYGFGLSGYSHYVGSDGNARQSKKTTYTFPSTDKVKADLNKLIPTPSTLKRLGFYKALEFGETFIELAFHHRLHEERHPLLKNVITVVTLVAPRDLCRIAIFFKCNRSLER